MINENEVIGNENPCDPVLENNPKNVQFTETCHNHHFNIYDNHSSSSNHHNYKHSNVGDRVECSNMFPIENTKNVCDQFEKLKFSTRKNQNMAKKYAYGRSFGGKNVIFNGTYPIDQPIGYRIKQKSTFSNASFYPSL